MGIRVSRGQCCRILWVSHESHWFVADRTYSIRFVSFCFLPFLFVDPAVGRSTGAVDVIVDDRRRVGVETCHSEPKAGDDGYWWNI